MFLNFPSNGPVISKSYNIFLLPFKNLWKFHYKRNFWACGDDSITPKIFYIISQGIRYENLQFCIYTAYCLKMQVFEAGVSKFSREARPQTSLVRSLLPAAAAILATTHKHLDWDGKTEPLASELNCFCITTKLMFDAYLTIIPDRKTETGRKIRTTKVHQCIYLTYRTSLPPSSNFFNGVFPPNRPQKRENLAQLVANSSSFKIKKTPGKWSQKQSKIRVSRTINN